MYYTIMNFLFNIPNLFNCTICLEVLPALKTCMHVCICVRACMCVCVSVGICIYDYVCCVEAYIYV